MFRLLLVVMAPVNLTLVVIFTDQSDPSFGNYSNQKKHDLASYHGVMPVDGKTTSSQPNC